MWWGDPQIGTVTTITSKGVVTYTVVMLDRPVDEPRTRVLLLLLLPPSASLPPPPPHLPATLFSCKITVRCLKKVLLPKIRSLFVSLQNAFVFKHFVFWTGKEAVWGQICWLLGPLSLKTCTASLSLRFTPDHKTGDDVGLKLSIAHYNEVLILAVVCIHNITNGANIWNRMRPRALV